MQSTKALTLRLPEELAEALRVYSFATNTPANTVIVHALTEYIREHGHTDMVQAAFKHVLEQHAVAFDKLASL